MENYEQSEQMGWKFSLHESDIFHFSQNFWASNLITPLVTGIVNRKKCNWGHFQKHVEIEVAIQLA